MKHQKQRIWSQWPHYCHKDPPVDSKCDELLNNWLFHKFNAECFSCISTTYYFIGIGVSAKLWTTHLQYSLSGKTKKWEAEAVSLKAEKCDLPSTYSKLNCSKVLIQLFTLKCKLLTSVLLRRKCYLFLAIKQQNSICLVAFNGNFPNM